VIILHVNWYIVGWFFQVSDKVIKFFSLSFETCEIKSRGKW